MSSLYTNIDNTEGLDPMKKFLHGAKSRSENAAVALMQLVLLCNNFIFDNEKYIQVKGMGTRAAPNYANLFMGDFEERFIYNTEWNTYLQYFRRYIDDFFMIWNGNEASLLEYVAYTLIAYTKQSNSRLNIQQVSSNSLMFSSLKTVKGTYQQTCTRKIHTRTVIFIVTQHIQNTAKNQYHTANSCGSSGYAQRKIH